MLFNLRCTNQRFSPTRQPGGQGPKRLLRDRLLDMICVQRTHVPDEALVAHRHAFDVGAYLGELRADAHELHVGLFVKARDVLGDGALEEAVVLGDEGEELMAVA